MLGSELTKATYSKTPKSAKAYEGSDRLVRTNVSFISLGSFIYEAYCTQEPSQNPEAYAVRFLLKCHDGCSHNKSQT